MRPECRHGERRVKDLAGYNRWVEKWVRKCASFEEERQADREFWATMTGDARVSAVDELRAEWATTSGNGYERLRRVIRRVQRPER